ncbi:MAG TPA: 2-hydroxyacyl-CoA dehydratase [Thermoplasmata archaeon]|nr:2-hydroxyacyl-CoA dehydratase [Thermoplasmata archaeon]
MLKNINKNRRCSSSNTYLGKVGITALVPPEIIYGCGWSVEDLNNKIPFTQRRPKTKLCAWAALWREMVLSSEFDINKLVVVAGGDCLNTVVEGQKIEMAGFKTHYFFYPFHKEKGFFSNELQKLIEFLGGLKDITMFERIHRIKEYGLLLDRLRVERQLPAETFRYLISFSDLRGDPIQFEKELLSFLKKIEKMESEEGKIRLALVGVPPINHDFHEACKELGFQVVFDELPYEFLRARGKTHEEIVNSYINYSFARPFRHRLKVIKNELKKREVDCVVHYTQYACHHILEDEILRETLDYPILTVQGDLPGRVSEQTKLRLEAFAEVLK